ncbi:MAG: hypothetical protein GY835_24945 [bacterium]|nr:hypothetical protein [bacterium]
MASSRVVENLTQAHKKLATSPLPVDIGEARFLFISDLHRGLGDGADDFDACEDAFCQCLEQYFDENFTLVVVGDAEELWEVREKDWPEIFEIHAASVERERAFLDAGRYCRLYGNHDLAWANGASVKKYLNPHLPNVQVSEALILELLDGPESLGRMFIIHGHQGDFFSDLLAEVSEVLVRELWARIQKVTELRSTRFSEERRIQGDHTEAVYYDWSARQPSMATLMGHTHDMVLEKIDSSEHYARIQRLITKFDTRYRRLRDKESKYNYRVLRDRWKSRLKRSAFQDHDGVFRMRPAYFNTGCCCFDNGWISGIEIREGELSLITWQEEKGRKTVASAHLSEVFRQLAVNR